MKIKALLLFVALACLFSAFTEPFVLAEENSLESGYYATSNHNSSEMQVTAATTNSKVLLIVFKWFAPDGSLSRFRIKFVWRNGTAWSNSTGRYTLQYATDKSATTTPGHWRVEVVFWTLNKVPLHCIHLRLAATRTIQFNTIPEVPVLGTAGIIGAMLAGFLLFKKRTKPL